MQEALGGRLPWRCLDAYWICSHPFATHLGMWMQIVELNHY